MRKKKTESSDLTIAAEAISHTAAAWANTGGLDNPVAAERFAADLLSRGYRIVRIADKDTDTA